MQNGYAITEAEYEQLRAAWKGILQADKLQLLNAPANRLWTAAFVPAILKDRGSRLLFAALCRRTLSHRRRRQRRVGQYRSHRDVVLWRLASAR
jgi:hypothetical protein